MTTYFITFGGTTMSLYLNVGVMQLTFNPDSIDDNLDRIESSVENMMGHYNRPELIVGGECLISFNEFDTIPGKATERLGAIAKKHGIYFVPGSLMETHPDLGEDEYYNTIPVFNPKGELIKVYRKMCPWAPGETSTPGEENYCVFDIVEKDITIGVANCYDGYFPEYMRNLTLLGAEVIVRPFYEALTLDESNFITSRVRAMENQVYHVAVGVCIDRENTRNMGASLSANSCVISPDGSVVYRAGAVDALDTIKLNIEELRHLRQFGNHKVDPSLLHMKAFKLRRLFNDNIEEAPVFKKMGKPLMNPEDYKACCNENNIGNLNNK